MKNAVETYRKNIIMFVEDIFGVTPDPLQANFLDIVNKMVTAKIMVTKPDYEEKKRFLKNEIEEYSKKRGISVRAGRGPGKTACCSWIIGWFLLCFPSKIMVTAPKQDLLRDNLWGEMHKWRASSIKKNGKNSLISTLEIQADAVRVKGYKENFCVARTCNKNASESEQIASVSGYHEDFMLVIADESYGISDIAYNTLEDTMTGKVNMAILIGNPTRNYGFAHDTVHKKGVQDNWVNLRMNTEESTLVTPEYIRQQKVKYKDNPNGYRVNVLGLEPLHEANALIPYNSIIDAAERELPRELWENEGLVFGVDVGAGRDVSCVTPKQGMKVHKQETYNSNKADEVARWVAQLGLKHEPLKIGVDGIGVGWGVVPLVKQEGFEVVNVDVRKRLPTSKDKFLNLRAELFWRLREAFVNNIIDIPYDDDLINELACLKLKDPDTTIKLQIISKKDMKADGIDSPNRADSLAIAMYFTDHSIRAVKSINDSYKHQQMTKEERGWMSA